MNDPVVLPDSSRSNVYGPITASQMFERAFALLRETPKLFFGIAAVLVGVEIVIGGVLGGSGFWVVRSSLGAIPITKALITAPLALLGGLIIYVFTQITHGAVFLAAQARLAKIPTTVGEICRIAVDNLGKLVGISLLVALRIFGYMLLFYFGFMIVGLAVALMFGGLGHFEQHLRMQPGMGFGTQMIGAGIAALLLLLALLILYILAFLWLCARYALSIPASLAENVSATQGIRRSIHLTRASKGRLYALILALFCVNLAIVAVAIPVQLMSVHAAGASVAAISGTAAGAVLILLAVFEYVAGAVVITFFGVGTALCYYDLRVRKEGFGAPTPVPGLEFRPATPLSTPDWPIEDLPVS